MSEFPVLPYGGVDDPNSGFAAGVETSEERARRDDSDGSTSGRQMVTLRVLAGRGAHGVTWPELARLCHWHHGQASGVLSVLHKTDRIARLTERRDRCFVYVLPEFVGDRETQQQGRRQGASDAQALALALEKLAQVEALRDEWVALGDIISEAAAERLTEILDPE